VGTRLSRLKQTLLQPLARGPKIESRRVSVQEKGSQLVSHEHSQASLPLLSSISNCFALIVHAWDKQRER
jgi:hypothetical protein